MVACVSLDIADLTAFVALVVDGTGIDDCSEMFRDVLNMLFCS